MTGVGWDSDLTATSIAVTGEFTLPTVDGVAGQTLVTDGSGVVTWSAGGGGGGGVVDTVTAGTNLNGGGSASTVTLNLDTTLTGLSSVTSTAFVGALTGNASTASAVAASALTGATLAAGVTASSLTSVGTLTSLTTTGDIEIAQDSNLWIGGTSNGTERLRLHHASSSGHAYIDYKDDLYFRADGSGSAVVLDTSGNVGIGTTSPSVPLHLNIGTDNSGILVESTDATARMSFKDSSTSGTTKVGIGAVGDDVTLWGGGSRRITAKSDGKVGIGTTAPDTNLEVVGSVRASTSFLVNSSGDDGIGHVTGSYGSVQTRGTGAGSWEGYSINGQQVFMGNGDERCGIYNDVDNQWLIEFDADTWTRLYDSDGIVAFGANNYTSGGTGSGGNGYIGISNYCGGFSGTTAKITSTTVAGVAMKRLGFNSSSYEFKSGIEDLAMSDEAFMSLKPITFHPNDQYVDLTGDVTEIPGGHTIVPDKTEAGNTPALLPLKRAGFGLEDLYGRDDTMILATEFSPDDTALIALLTLKLQETMTRVAVLEDA